MPIYRLDDMFISGGSEVANTDHALTVALDERVCLVNGELEETKARLEKLGEIVANLMDECNLTDEQVVKVLCCPDLEVRNDDQ